MVLVSWSGLTHKDIPKALNGEKARLWEVAQPFPHFQKECGCSACFLGCLSRFAHELVLAANVGPKHNKSCFMNMIDSDRLLFAKLKAVVSFCSQTKAAASCQKFFSCVFFGSSWSSDTAIQVTGIVRWHMHQVSCILWTWSLVSSCLEALFSFSHPLVSPRLPPKWKTSVFPFVDKRPLRTIVLSHQFWQ